MTGAVTKGLTGLVALVIGAMAGAQSRAVPMTTFSDSANGVSFQYLSVWKRVPEVTFYSRPQLLLRSSQPPQPKLLVEFSPDRNYYERTSLEGLVFVYAAVPSSDGKSCERIVSTDASQNDRKGSVSIHGIKFQHIETGGAATGHQSDDNIYWIERSGQCYLFEADLYTVAVDPPKHYLIQTESQALKRHLNDIVQSIRIEGK